MKTLLKAILFCAICFTFSIKTNAQDLLQTFKNQPHVETVAVNKKMFQMMSNVKIDQNDKENQAYLNLIKKLDDLKMVSTKNSAAANKMNTFVVAYVNANTLKELMQLSENGSTTIFYVDANSNKENIKELMMFVNVKEVAILSLKGNFSLNEVSVLTSKMKLPIGNSLKQ